MSGKGPRASPPVRIQIGIGGGLKESVKPGEELDGAKPVSRESAGQLRG